MHDKKNIQTHYSTLQMTGFITTAGILTILAGCGQKGKNGKNGADGITGGATITSASCSTSDPTSSTLNVTISNTTTEVLTLKETGLFDDISQCAIFTTLSGSTPSSYCYAGNFSNGIPSTIPLPIGTTSVAFACDTGSCTGISGISCEGQAYAPPNSTTPGLAFVLDNIFGTIP